MMNPKDDKQFMQVLEQYLLRNNFALPGNAKFDYIIDGIYITVNGDIVLAVGDRPPEVIYDIHKTEHTDKYLRSHMAHAV